MARKARKKKTNQRKKPRHKKAPPKHRRMARRSAPKELLTRGHDFGLPIRMMAVAPPEFSQRLHEAEILGVAYGVAPCAELKATIPLVTLMARNEAAVVAAFKEFERWGAGEDGDAVELALVFTREDEYTVAIGPEIRRLIERLTEFNRLHDALSMAGTWMLPIPNARNSLVKEFIEGFSLGPVRPFMLHAAIWTGAGKDVFDSNALRPIASLTPILKFACTIVKPGDKPTTPSAHIAFNLAVRRRGERNREASKPVNPPPLSAPGIFERRRKVISTYFPVTVERLRVFGLTDTTARILAEHGLRPWQVEQAVCNIKLSQRLCKGVAHYPDVDSEEALEEMVIRGLMEQVEEVDGRFLSLHDIPADEIVSQAESDARVLLRAWGHLRRAHSLAEVQEELNARGLLDG